LSVLSYCWTSKEVTEQLPAVRLTLNWVVAGEAAGPLTVTGQEKWLFNVDQSSGEPPP